MMREVGSRKEKQYEEQKQKQKIDAGRKELRLEWVEQG